MDEMLMRFATGLGVKTDIEENRIQNVSFRLVHLGHGITCSRCGGSGHYSYNRMYGTTCFKCNGRGQQAPKLTEKLLQRVIEQVTNGELEPYLQDLRNKAMARLATKKVMKAWEATEISKKYRWQDACTDPEARRLADLNAIMCKQYEIVSRMELEFTHGQRKGEAQLAAEIVTASEEAIRIITDTAKLI